MNTGNLRRYGLALSIIAGLILVACQPSSMEVVETAPESTYIPLADVYFSEGLGVTYEDLANAHESYQNSLGNNSDSALESSEGASLNPPTGYIPSAFESVDHDDLSYWADALSVPDEKLLVAKLQATNKLLDDAVGMGLITEDQAKMTYYITVIDQATSNPALWAAAVGISTEEFERFVQLGFNYEDIAAWNFRSAEDVYRGVYINYLSSLDPATSPPHFDQPIFLTQYKPASDGCFSSNNFSGLVNVPAEVIPVSQATACPPSQYSTPCSPEECGYPDDGTGPITGGVGGGNLGGVSAAEKGYKEITGLPLTPPPIVTGFFNYGNRDDTKRVNDQCANENLLLFIIGVQGSHTITFYYDRDGDNTLDDSERTDNEEYSRVVNTGQQLYACAPIYSGIEFRWDDSNKGANSPFMCISYRAKSDYISCGV